MQRHSHSECVDEDSKRHENGEREGRRENGEREAARGGGRETESAKVVGCPQAVPVQKNFTSQLSHRHDSHNRQSEDDGF